MTSLDPQQFTPTESNALSVALLHDLTIRLDVYANRCHAERRGRPRFRGLDQPELTVLEWGRTYLPDYFTLPPSKLHKWLGVQLDRLQTYRGTKINVVGPRGAAKSTVVTLSYVLQAALEGWERYIWIVSDTRHQAKLHLNNIKSELLDNDRLASDYPRGTGRGAWWTDAHILLRNAVLIEAIGSGQSMRGQRYRQHRPTLIVCDDLQNDSHIASAVQRETSRRWFDGALLKAGARNTNVINLATALHREALAMELLQAPGWKSKLFRAIETWPTNKQYWEEWEKYYCNVDDHDAKEFARMYFEDNRAEMEAGAVLLWPEEEDLYTLMQMRVESGHTAFEREKQGSPLDPKSCDFPDSYFTDSIWFNQWPDDLLIRVIALDPSKGKDARRGDYSAYVLLGVEKGGLIYVEADLARRPTPQMIADGAKLCLRFQPRLFAIEANQFQELLEGEFAEEFKRQKILDVAISGIHNLTNKQLRIRQLEPYLSRNRFRFLAGSDSTRLLVNQLRDFPAGAHDDGPDALEMALRIAMENLYGASTDDGLGQYLLDPT